MFLFFKKTQRQLESTDDDSTRLDMSTEDEFTVELVYAALREVWAADDAADPVAAARREFDTTAKPEALELCAKLVRAFVKEATARACEAARVEGDRAVDGTHLERVLPQLLLDFAS